MRVHGVKHPGQPHQLRIPERHEYSQPESAATLEHLLELERRERMFQCPVQIAKVEAARSERTTGHVPAHLGLPFHLPA